MEIERFFVYLGWRFNEDWGLQDDVRMRVVEGLESFGAICKCLMSKVFI